MTKPKLPIWFPRWLREISPHSEGPRLPFERSSKLALIQPTKGGRQMENNVFRFINKNINYSPAATASHHWPAMPIVLLCHLTLNLVLLESYLQSDVTIIDNEISIFLLFLFFFFRFSFFEKRKERKSLNTLFYSSGYVINTKEKQKQVGLGRPYCNVLVKVS